MVCNGISIPVGMVWQPSSVTPAIYLVLRSRPWVAGSLVALIATSRFLKSNWLDRLRRE